MERVNQIARRAEKWVWYVAGVAFLLAILGAVVITAGVLADASDVRLLGFVLVAPLVVLAGVGLVVFVVASIVSMFAIRNRGERNLCIGLFSAMAVAVLIGLLIRLL